jgi:hypothetical protein
MLSDLFFTSNPLSSIRGRMSNQSKGNPTIYRQENEDGIIKRVIPFFAFPNYPNSLRYSPAKRPMEASTINSACITGCSIMGWNAPSSIASILVSVSCFLSRVFPYKK